MRTIAHISDLHFGRIDPPVAEGLISDLKSRGPTLLVVSGDFTQRARRKQYEQAAAYLKRLPKPQLVVPGNHDVPAFNPVSRFFFPLKNYLQYITPDLLPSFLDDELFVLGVNTARSFTRTSGWISMPQMRAIRLAASRVPEGVFKVLVTHQPFIPAPRKPEADVLVGGARSLKELESSGFDMVLAGHLHLAYHDDVRAHHKSARRSVLSIQAGTATSTRLRGEPNAYNWISVSRDLITVVVRAWNGKEFAESLVTRYERLDHVWRTVEQSPVSPTTAASLDARASSEANRIEH